MARRPTRVVLVGLALAALTATMRSAGATQVTYNGHPVYMCSGDKNPGDTNGEGINAFGGIWNVLDASGNRVTGSSTPTTTSSISGN